MSFLGQRPSSGEFVSFKKELLTISAVLNHCQGAAGEGTGSASPVVDSEGCSWVPWSVKFLWLGFCKARSHVCYSHTEWFKKKKKSMPLRTRGKKKAGLDYRRASPVAKLVKNPPAMQETPVQFLGREDPLEKA